MIVRRGFFVQVSKKRRSLVFLILAGIFVFIYAKNWQNKYNGTISGRQWTITKMKSSSLSYNDTSCVVIVREIGGRLGNTLFRFASAYGIARTHACRLYVERWIIDQLSLLFEFRLRSTITLEEVKRLEDIESRYTECEFFPDLLIYNAVQHLELKGYWQAYGHFIKYAHELKTYFRIRKNIIAKIAKLFTVKPVSGKAVHKFATDTNDLPKRRRNKTQLSDLANLNDTRVELNHSEMKMQVRNSNITWVGVHIRRGDSIEVYKAESSFTYIINAMNYYQNKFKNVFFIMASDDKDYCKKLFANRTNVIITPESYSYLEDFATLSFCQHSIITAGTYGWWTAFLAGGDVIHDVKFRAEKCVNCKCSREFYYPPWFLFPPEAS
jgi:hypothetical protein